MSEDMCLAHPRVTSQESRVRKFSTWAMENLLDTSWEFHTWVVKYVQATYELIQTSEYNYLTRMYCQHFREIIHADQWANIQKFWEKSAFI